MFRPDKYIDMSKTDFDDIFSGIESIWNILPIIEKYITEKDVQWFRKRGYKEHSEGVYVGKNSIVAPDAVIKAPAIIGHRCEIRHAAFIRGKAIIGNNVTVGNSCEIKNSFICDEAQIPHFNYVGDAVLGYKSHLGAGVICSNVRSVPGNVKVRNGDEKIDTGLRKFSAIVSDNAEVGCNAVLSPGSIVGRNSVVYPLSFFRGVLKDNKIYKQNGEISDLRSSGIIDFH